MKTPCTIAFIDDDRDFLLAQRAFFGARGYTVLVAESVEGAREMLATSRPDIIVLDLMMDHYDSGFTLSHALRKDPRFQQTPIIMVSGVAATTGQRIAADTKTLAGWSHLDLFLDKPVSGRDLLKAVEARLAPLPSTAHAG